MTKKSWRDVLPIHPAAELFPPMSPDELRALAKDIKQNGLRLSCSIVAKCGKRVLIDGRNRLDALELLGDDERLNLDNSIVFEELPDDTDIYARIVSTNIHRRHLTAEQKRDLVAKLLKATPEKSDRQIAKTVKASPTFVGKVRAEKEAAGDVSTVDTRRDSKGRRQPARKTKRATDPPPAKPLQASVRDDVGPASSSEIARKDAELEELRNAKRRLEIENVGLRSEIEEKSPELAAKLEPLIESLFYQGTRSMATMAPPAVMIAVVKLERLLVEHGIMPKSRRSEDPDRYVRAIRDKERREWDKAHPLKTPPATSSNSAPPPDPWPDLPVCLRRASP